MTIHDFIGPQGQPTPAGRTALAQIRDLIQAVLSGHLDNTGARCRIDLGNVVDLTRGHDCCAICNQVAGALRGAAEEARR